MRGNRHSQTVLDGYFAMILIAEISALQLSFGDFVDLLAKLGKENGLQIHTMHEDIFNYREELTEAGADHIVQTPMEILNYC